MMFLVKANTVIQIFAPFGKFGSKSTLHGSWSNSKRDFYSTSVL